jgi:Na+-transporting methylmalonyl-CoA/oxaloacetate decarboxylase gamma subunit
MFLGERLMIEKYLGISSDYVIIGLAGLVLLTMILLIVFIVQMAKLKKRYKIFMQGNDAKSLEDTLVYRLEQVDELIEANASNERNIDMIFKNMKDCFQKIGLVKYDAFNEMGGKLSFSLCLLNEKNNGFIINAMHSREGCYTYVKEIIDGNSIIQLADEEEQALQQAIGGI